MNKAKMVFNKLAQDGTGIKNRVTPLGKGFQGTSVMGFGTGTSRRYYQGRGEGLRMDSAMRNAKMQANLKFNKNPADSITTQQYNKFK